MESTRGELDTRNVKELPSALFRRESSGHARAQTLDFKGI
jgi:hypothetical protein